MALLASKRLAGGLVRAGDIPGDGIVVVPGVESIDVSDLNTGFLSLNHSAFADRQPLIADLQTLLANKSVEAKHPPDKRIPNYKPFGIDAKKWWKYVK